MEKDRETSQTVLITGCSSGIGEATALAFARLNMHVWATVRPGSKIPLSLKKAGCHVIELDVTDEQSRIRAVKAVERESGAVSILVNNAGYGQHGPIEEVSLEQVQRQFDTNVFGMMRMCQLVLPGMRKKQSGTIINVGSGSGFLTAPLWGVYSMSKHAVESLSDALRFEVRTFGIRIVLIEPQPVDSNFFGHSIGPGISDGPYEELKKRIDEVAKKAYQPGAKNLSKPEELADIIVKAALSSHPKTRYRVGIQKFLYLMRVIMPDRMIDNMFARQIGVK